MTFWYCMYFPQIACIALMYRRCVLVATACCLNLNSDYLLHIVPWLSHPISFRPSRLSSLIKWPKNNNKKDVLRVRLSLIAATCCPPPTRTRSRLWSPISPGSSHRETLSLRTTARPWRGRHLKPACPTPERAKRSLLPRPRANCGLSLRTRTR